MFDPCQHLVGMILIAAGREIRKAKGDPEEMNVSKLQEEACKLLGISIDLIRHNTIGANKFPSMYEMGIAATQAMQGRLPETPPGISLSKEEQKIIEKLMEHKQDCPDCGKKSMELQPICQRPTCKDSEGGKFKSEWVCIGVRDDKGNMVERGCNRRDKNEKAFVQFMDEWGIDYTQFSKQRLGIKTVTDQGTK